MAQFRIQFRLHGYAKDYAKELIYDVAKRFRVKGVTKGAVVPHTTLYGRSETNNIEEVVSKVEKIGQEYTVVPFEIVGFGYFDSERGKVIYLDIDPSPELEALRWDLAKGLRKISPPQPWDTKRQFQFHVTIAREDVDQKFNAIWEYITKRERPNINQQLLRITVLKILDEKRSRILYEYDLVLKKLLNRTQALSRYWWRKTINKKRELHGELLCQPK